MELLGKFYFKFEKILIKICEILEQTLKRLEFLGIVYEAQYNKIKPGEITGN